MYQSGRTPNIDDLYADLQTPSTQDLQLQLEEMVLQGTLSPEQAQTIMLDPSAMGGITLDPALKQAQMDALLGLQDISDSGGMTAMDRANMSRISNEEDAKARGAREAIMQQAQARGMGGSGMEILSQLQNAQESASRRSARDTEVAGMAQQRALEALMQGGNMAGNIRGQEFSEQAQKAQAADAIAKFNAQNQQQQVNINTAARNDAREKNLNAAQTLSNANTGIRNQEQQFNKQLPQQKFENELKKRGAQTGVLQANQQAQGQNSQNQANANNQMLGTALTTAAMFMSDERQKEDIDDFDAGAFLDSLTGKKYRYKDEKYGKGEQAGVIAQDLLKTPEGSSAVHQTDEGMMVDSGKASNLALASAADLHKRLKKLEGK
jgi:hypothetical protein